MERGLYRLRRMNPLLLLLIHMVIMMSEMERVWCWTRADGRQPGVARFCRDRFDLWQESRFRRRACALCYAYLFPTGKDLVPAGQYFEYLVYRNMSFYGSVQLLVADPNNRTSMNTICLETLNENECVSWQACCREAEACCQQQVSARQEAPHSCPPTWDGFACWDYTEAGQSVTAECPDFLPHAIPARKAVKKCTKNGTWYKLKDVAWTDYRPCLDKESYIQSTFLGVGCNVASIALALPAVLIFICYKDLLRQDRIRIHLNFFMSLISCGICTILWDMLVHYDKLTNPDTTATMMYRNTAWCKIVSALKIYFSSTNYFWMLCEGYYLHQLITNAFEPPRTLVLLYSFGWGMPVLHTSAYSIVRAVMANEHCWAYSFGNYEWIIYTPNLSCLLINLFFLCNILRILMFQLHSHPHEPSSFRRGLKAAFMLVPLFGLQLFLTIYRLPVTAPGQRAYEMVTFFVINSQGAFVAIIFCFFNSEVLAHLRNTFPCLRRSRFRKFSRTLSTNNTTHYTVSDSPSKSCNGLPSNAKAFEAGAGSHEVQSLRHGDSGGGGTGRSSAQYRDGYLLVPVNHDRDHIVSSP